MFSLKKDRTLLFVGVFLVALLSFACGFIVAEKNNKEPIRIEYEKTKNSYCWGRYLWSLFS
jgi:hypothetical protein